MAYDENLANRIRESLSSVRRLKEKQMMGGLTFMVNDKMCVGIFRGDLMCRVNPAEYESLLDRKGCLAMEFGGKIMKGYILVDETGRKTNKDFQFWIDQALAFNKDAKASKKRTASKKKVKKIQRKK